MPLKSYTQQALEAQHGNKPTKQILLEALDSRRGEKNLVQKVALHLGLSDATIYNYCRDLNIDLSQYR